MKLNIKRAYSIEKGKTYDLVTVWEEDDARPPDRESIYDAWERFTGRDYVGDKPTDYQDNRGDWVATLYRGGWVTICSCEGTAIAVLVEVALESE